MAFGRERERVTEERTRARESARGSGWLRGVVRGIQTRRGEAGRQASWWRGAVARARAGHTPLPLSRTKTTKEEVGWAATGLHSNGLHREVSPGKSLLPLVFLFYFLTYVLI